MTVTGRPLGDNLDRWESSERRARFREALQEADGVDPADVIMAPDRARERGLTSTVCFPTGNLAPQGSVVKSTSIDPAVLDDNGVYHLRGPARVFTTERQAIAALKAREIKAGDVMVLISCGPMGSGMEEIAQITTALKYLDYGKHVAVLTDARFSGFSTGACIGHIGPEALAGGPIGKLQDGDTIEITIDTRQLRGEINLVVKEEGSPEGGDAVAAGDSELAKRQPRADLAPEEELPDATRLWAALQNVGGGTWGGCVYDVDAIIQALESGQDRAGSAP